MTFAFSAIDRVDLLDAIAKTFPEADTRTVMPIIANYGKLIRYLADASDLTIRETMDLFETRIPMVLPRARSFAA